MDELKIHGHSGCGLRIVEDDRGNLLVEKSCKESYVERLHKQYVKQLHAAQVSRNVADSPFDTPYPSWVASNNVMLMPYINSMSFVEYFERATKADIDNLISNIIEYIKREIISSSLKEVPKDKLMSKVKSVYETAMKNDVLNDDDKKDVENACAYVLSKLDKHPGSCLTMRVGKCHGDMTFSNILFRSSGRHSLIDFLDSFIETPLQDLVKIRQDSAYGWSLMMTTTPYNEAHIKTVLQYIDRRIMQHFSNYENFTEYYDMMQFINILRIIPYVKEHHVFERLIEILNTIDL